jgi:hypothetical protein
VATVVSPLSVSQNASSQARRGGDGKTIVTSQSSSYWDRYAAGSRRSESGCASLRST